jgi:hypothetical protein
LFKGSRGVHKTLFTRKSAVTRFPFVGITRCSPPIRGSAPRRFRLSAAKAMTALRHWFIKAGRRTPRDVGDATSLAERYHWESGPILRSMGYTGGGERETDRITEQSGWRLLDRSRLTLRLPREQVISHRHHLRLRFVVGDTAESLTAESFGKEARWFVPLLTVKTQYWQSYGWPPRPSPTPQHNR